MCVCVHIATAMYIAFVFEQILAPASQETTAMYAAYLAQRLKSSSVRQYLNIVRIIHLGAGLVSPLKDSWYIISLPL